MYKNLVIILGVLGSILPIFILAIDWYLGGWFPVWIFVIWPTAIALMPFSGFHISIYKLIVFIVAALVNGAIYASVGFTIRSIFNKNSK